MPKTDVSGIIKRTRAFVANGFAEASDELLAKQAVEYAAKHGGETSEPIARGVTKGYISEERAKRISRIIGRMSLSGERQEIEEAAIASHVIH